MELFGTDGVRGIPGEPPLTAESVERLAEAAARELCREGAAGPVLLARDTRASGVMLTRSLARGFARAGCRPLIDLGVLPTPGLARLTASRRAAFGVVVSASHNPPEFNGIKFFDASGCKLDPKIEQRIEKDLTNGNPHPTLSFSRRGNKKLPLLEKERMAGGQVRIAVADTSAVQEYLDFLISTFPADLDLSGVRIVADASQGAASRFVGPLLRRLGADVRVIGDKPNGRNINTGFGALATGAMQKEVKRCRAHCGFSLDGDADRVLFADETGRLLSGDALIGMAAAHHLERGTLGKPKVVLTVMSNAGIVRYLNDKGVRTVLVPVGDRNVSHAMDAEGLALGGENSGHIIFSRFSRAGDGLLTALQVLAILRASGKPLSWFRRAVPVYPSELVNLPVKKKLALDSSAAIRAAVARGEKAVAGGRVYLRYSGTEPLLRILVEGPKGAAVRRVARELTAVCRKELNEHAN